MELSKRTADSITDGLGRAKFTSCPGDKMIIKSHRNIISNTVDINLINEARAENVHFCVSNIIDAWKWLKDINETEARKVTFQIDDEPEMPFENSMPYKSRFGQ